MIPTSPTRHRSRQRSTSARWAWSAAVVCLLSAAASLPALAVPNLTIDDAFVTEGNFGTTLLKFPVRLSAPSDGSTLVQYATGDGTATSGQDYESASGALSFPAGSVTDTIVVLVHGDDILEGNETVLMKVVSTTSANPTRPVAYGTIENDERTTFQFVNGGFATYNSTIPPSWCDYDKNGWLDMPLQDAQSPYVFQEIPGFRPLLAAGEYHGGAWCDYDKDSWPDLVLTPYVSNVETHVLLLHNQGNGTFTNAAPALGMDTAGFGETAVWADFDADGWPDLFLPFYSHVAPFRSFLYRNNGNGTFTERAVQAGVDLPGLPFEFRPEGASAADWDG